MPAKRVNREELCAKLALLDENRLRKVLWNLHWRGSAARHETRARMWPGPAGIAEGTDPLAGNVPATGRRRRGSARV